MNDKANLVATLLGTLGILFFMAMAFDILPNKIAIFAGVACFILAGAAKRMMRQNNR